ncbi:MAG: hypothetical protein Q4C47_04245 [Planctomycetia bacterium]|nr:hypothetical protein [Planctomycetia bacterium]
MDLVHRITLEGHSLTQDDRNVLERVCGVSSRKIGYRTVFLSMKDDDPRWPTLREILTRTSGRDLPVRCFTNGERNVASWLAISPVSHHGWPGTKPIRDRLQSLFATPGTTICPRCESERGTPRSPLFLAGEPRWTNSDFLQIDGFRDLWFTRPEVYHEIFRPFGVRSRPVLHRTTGEPLRTVVELRSTMEDAPLRIPEEPAWNPVRCPGCDAAYFNVGEWGGWLPGDRVIPPFDREISGNVHFLTTRERFFSTRAPEGTTWRVCAISQPLFRAIRFHHLRGIACEPIGWSE